MNVLETVSAYGPEAVGISELVAMAAGITPEKLISLLGGGSIGELFEKSLPELRKLTTPGIAGRIFAIGEVMRRQRMLSGSARPTINSPQDIDNLLMEEMRHLDRENFRVVLLNTKNGVLKVETVSVGTLNASLVHPREIFKAAVKANANAVILVHNHPSGDPTPSREDIEATKRIMDAGKLMGIEVLDHIIIGDGRYVSLKEQGIV